MKIPEFNHETKRWDRFERFYYEPLPGFFVMEGGELLIDRGWRDLDIRSLPGWNITLFKPRCVPANHELRRGSTFKTPGGLPIKWSWLAQSDAMLFDHDHNRVVMLDYHYSNYVSDRHVPEYAGTADVYYANTKAPPSPLRPLVVAFPPHTQITPEYRRLYAGLRRQARLLVKLGVVTAPAQYNISFTPDDVANLADEGLLDKMASWDQRLVRALADDGVRVWSKDECFDYLVRV